MAPNSLYIHYFDQSPLGEYVRNRETFGAKKTKPRAFVVQTDQPGVDLEVVTSLG